MTKNHALKGGKLHSKYTTFTQEYTKLMTMTRFSLQTRKTALKNAIFTEETAKRPF